MKFISRFIGQRGFSEAMKAHTVKIPTEGEDTAFDLIVKRKIPADIVFEDNLVIGFRDIAPKAPVHIVLIPKNRDGLINLQAAESRHKEILGHLMIKAAEIAKSQGLEDGWRLISNNGVNACQSVYHLHFHIIGGKKLDWPHT